MTVVFTRRAALRASAGGALAALLARPFAAFADDSVETHGLSSFGDLALPPDFPHFAYVNPEAPTGGLLSLQITGTSGNQNFDTFDTLNIYSWKGNGAAGMSATFDTLMTANGDEPDSVYGLLAQSVRVSGDKLDYRFRLRPEAKFFDGSRVTAGDVAFSLNVLKEKGHPVYAQLLKEVESANAEGDDVAHVRFVKDRSRDAHLIVVGMPVFSAAWWKDRDFAAATLDAPLGSGAYKVKAFEQGRFIEYARDPNYWGAKLPVNLGQNNFDRLRFEYYRERQVAFEAFKAGAINYHEEYTSRFWATAYDFPAAKDGRVKKEVLHNGAPVNTQGWYLNTRREQFSDPRVREAIGLAFDFEWTNKNVMYSSYKRIISYFANTDMEAKGKPGPDELKLLEPFRDKLAPSVFDDPYTPPVSDGSGADRTLLKQAYDLLLSAGCKRDGRHAAPERQAADHRIPRQLERHAAAYDAVHPEPWQARHPGEPAHRRRRAAQKPHGGLRLRRRDRGACRFDDAGRGPAGRLLVRGRQAERFAQPRRRRRPGRRRAGRDDRQREIARGAQRRPAARSTACCALATIGCRCGIATPPGSPIGTPSRGPSASRSSAPARQAPGGGTKERPRRLDCDRNLECCLTRRPPSAS